MQEDGQRRDKQGLVGQAAEEQKAGNQELDKTAEREQEVENQEVDRQVEGKQAAEKQAEGEQIVENQKLDKQAAGEQAAENQAGEKCAPEKKSDRKKSHPSSISSNDVTEEEYLKNYKPGDYERPSVTADILVFTLSDRGELSLLLIQRGGHPFKGCWALPGGFVNMDESLDEAARRELFEETNLRDVYMEQLATFGEVGRDPRMRVISVAYLGLAPKGSISGRIRGGDDAKKACLFQIKQRSNGSFVFLNEELVIMFSETELAFDHAKIIHEGVNRIRGKLNYTDIAFELLEDKEMFTMADLRVAYEAISGAAYPASNFTRNITTRYIKPGKMVEMNERVMAGNGMKVALYEYHKNGAPDANSANVRYEELLSVRAGVKDGNMYGFGAASKIKRRRGKEAEEEAKEESGTGNQCQIRK